MNVSGSKKEDRISRREEKAHISEFRKLIAKNEREEKRKEKEFQREEKAYVRDAARFARETLRERKKKEREIVKRVKEEHAKLAATKEGRIKD